MQSEIITEDDIYRASTQYRLWSYTPESLASLRSTTNRLAAEQVVLAKKRASPSSTDDTTPLTVDEELLLIEYYAEATLSASDKFTFPTAVKATAVQYLKRFYLSHSPMTYHPKQIFPTCLFFATKTENHHIPLSTFAAKFPKTTSEDVLAPEHMLAQALRFAFALRHPHRGLRGGMMELLAMARGEARLLPSLGKTPAEVRREMKALPPRDGDKARDVEERCERAVGRAQETLGGAALLTDAYFLYSPAQIWLAALLLADEPLARFYLGTKFPDTGPVESEGGQMGDGEEQIEEEQLEEKAIRQTHKDHVLRRLVDCADLLGAHVSSSAKGEEGKQELIRIDKKLYQCLNPEKKDLVGLNRAQKRPDDEDAEERAKKKRKLEMEERAADDVFGGPLTADKQKDSG